MSRLLNLLIRFSPLFSIVNYYYQLLKLHFVSQRDLISIVVPLYNEEKFVLDTLISVQKQSYKNIECIIVDDFSKDSSRKLVETFCLKDPRFSLICHEKNKGLSVSRNTGMKRTKGKYILFLDSDDLLTKHSLLFKWDKIKKSHSFSIAVTSRVLYCQEDKVSFSKKLRSFIPSKFEQYLHFSNWNYTYPFMVHGALFKSKEIKAFAGFNEELRGGCEDYEFWMRILRHGYIFESSVEVGGFYRQKKGSMLLGNHLKHFKVLSSLVDSNLDEYAQQEVKDCPYFFSKRHSIYQAEYAKFDRYIRFNHYLGVKSLETAQFDPELLIYFHKIYPHYKVRSFLRAVSS